MQTIWKKQRTCDDENAKAQTFVSSQRRNWSIKGGNGGWQKPSWAPIIAAPRFWPIAPFLLDHVPYGYLDTHWGKIAHFIQKFTFSKTHL